MKLKHVLLTEAVFNVDKLVDHIYEEVYEDFIDDIQSWKNGAEPSSLRLKITNKNYDEDQIASRTNSNQIEEALELNPIQIFAGMSLNGNYYSPLESYIQLSFNQELYDFIQNAKRKDALFWDTIGYFPKKLIKRLMSEFDGNKIRASIAHELSHWLDDTFHNRHLKNKSMNARENNRSIVSNLNIPDIALSSFERDANIHALVEVKRRYSQEEWDNFTFEDLEDLDPAFHAVTINLLLIKGAYPKWKKYIIKRMHREGILGKNMR